MPLCKPSLGIKSPTECHLGHSRHSALVSSCFHSALTSSSTCLYHPAQHPPSCSYSQDTFPTLNLYACYSFCPEWSSSRSFQDLFPHLIQVSPECHSWEAFPVLPPPKAATHPLPSLSQPFPLPCFLQNTITFSESIIHFFVHCLLPL